MTPSKSRYSNTRTDAYDAYDSVGRFLYIKGSLTPQHVYRLREIDEAWRGPQVDEILDTLRARGVSLRQVDWLVSKYGVSNPIVQWKGDVAISLGEVYYGMLKVWRRRAFDCFARHSKVFYQGADGTMKQTSVGQLNFWHVMNRDFGFAEVLRRPALLEAVREDMQKDTNKGEKKRKRSRRKAPPVSPTIKMRALRQARPG